MNRLASDFMAMTLAPSSVRLGMKPEESTALSVGPWTQVTSASPVSGNDVEFVLPARDATRFYRLRQVETAALTTIIDSSPTDGETGAAVTRETIVYFSAPLAPDTLLGTDRFHATFGGRRLLSRIKPSTDRRKATLFYLERCPGVRG